MSSLLEQIEELNTPTDSSASSASSLSENIFFHDYNSQQSKRTPINEELYLNADWTEPNTPTTVQKNLCLNATSATASHHEDTSDSDSEHAQQAKLCICATSKPSKDEAVNPPPRINRPANATAVGFPFHTHEITDNYRITHEVIGIGESGKVMACYNKTTNQKYALKVLRDAPKARREVELHYLASVHENILAIIDIYENTFTGVKCLLVVVEFCEGGDLLSRFESQNSIPYSEKQVSEIIRQLGAAVQFLHGMNIAHRDIKLENILCSTKGENCVYKLGDFGFAKRPERNCLMESPCCTPYYVAPEVLGRERYDKSCDIWSIGVVILCGYPPFYSMKGIPLSPGMKSRISSGYYEFPSPQWDGVSDVAKDEIRAMLVTDPHRRLTIDELMLSEFITGRPSRKPMAIPQAPVQGLGISLAVATPKQASAVAPRSVMFMKEGVKAPRLHSIQEEVNRALDRMRLGTDDVTCNLKPPLMAQSALLARRRSAAAGGPLTINAA